jgi:Fe-S-cluster containining protein
MNRHFACTACGKCCSGLLPLLLDEALEHAERFPLAMVWTVVRPDSKAFDLTKRIGTTVKVARRREVAVQISAMAYMPEAVMCPALTEENLCGIHPSKPIRCRTMPFYPYQEESDQDKLLIPRAGWTCDISGEAPLVYRDEKILAKGDFDEERHRLEEQAHVVKAYANRLVASSASLVRELEVLSKRASGGRLALGFTGILPRLPNGDIMAFAKRQLPVLRRFANITASEASHRKFHDYYQLSIRGLEIVSGSCVGDTLTPMEEERS